MSEVKVNKISPRTNCGTVTLGDSGDTFTIPAGATITNNGTAAGFGATGAASWDTTVKTSGFTAVSGVGYFVNTTGGAISVNLPAGSAGDVVAIKDYAGTFDSNALSLVPNGSDKIGGINDTAIVDQEGIAVTLVFVDSTQGWLVTDDGLQSSASVPTFITATGGTITTSGDFKIHTFTGPGTFCVSGISSSAANNEVSYIVVAGGGGGGSVVSAGGGGGGFRERKSAVDTYTASPLNGATPITVTATGFPITVGAAGTGGAVPDTFGAGGKGGNSVFSTITSTGGGGAGNDQGTGQPGGSGGGRLRNSVGTGNTPPVSPPQGNPGGCGSTCGSHYAGGGGGATAAGGAGAAPAAGGVGGAGATTEINGSPKSFSGGGGGSSTVNISQTATLGNGGVGGGGGASMQGPNPTGSNGGVGFNNGADGIPGTDNTGGAGGTNSGGGGGGGAHNAGLGGAGGSGIVIIRYKFQ